MARVHIDGLTIPPIDGLSEFRTWIGSLGEEAPRAAFVDGEVFVEMAPQTFDIHQPLVDEINSTLRYLATDLDLGRYFFPPSWITHASAGLSNEPDGFLVRWQSFESGRVQVAPERRSELMGAPDFAFEAVSPSSASKDLVHLREVYAAAGVSEYWIADARQDVQLTLLTLTSGAYEQVEPVDGWVASPFW